MGVDFDQITEAQRECLRLVLSHHNSKEIAAKLGVSPSAIDKRIERAVQLLGVTSRFAAARLLAEHEGATSDRIPSELIDVPEPSGPDHPGAAEGPWGPVRRLLGLPTARRFEGYARVRLNVGQRLGIVAALIAFIAITSVVLLNLANTVSSLISSYHVSIPR